VISLKNNSRFKFLVDLAEIIIIAFALSWLLRTFVIEGRIVPTGSMLPTIQLNDQIMVDKFFFKHFGEIERGDIIVFKPPKAAHATDDFIKRVIGLPGDTIEIKGHQTYVNGEPIDEPYLLEAANEDFGPVVVPEGHLFVMGDNRNNSDDSRKWGFLPIENVSGKALFCYWPLNHFGKIE